MKQTRYNYRGRPASARLSHEREVDYLRTQPTAKQKKFRNGLCATLREHGIDNTAPHSLITRSDYAFEIDRLIALCRENGIEVHAQGKKMACCVYYDDNGFKGDSRISERLVECKQDGES